VSDEINEIMAYFDPALLESDKSKAKSLLKTNKMAKGKDEHARGMRAYLRAIAGGRDADYLLTQKGKMGAGAKHAKKLLKEDTLAEASGIPEPADGMKVKAKGVFAKGLKDGTVYTLKTAKPHGGVPTFMFVTKRGKKAARFGKWEIKRFLRTGMRGDHNGLVVESFDGPALNERMNSAEKSLIAKLEKITKGWGDGWSSWTDSSKFDGDPASATFEFEFEQHAKQFAQKAKSLGVKAGKVNRRRQTARGDGPKFMWEVDVTLPKATMTEDFTAAELDSWWAGARPKLIKGSRSTRYGRMAGCIKSLRALRDGGIKVSGLSQTDKNPVPRKERDSEDQPVDATPGKVDEDITIEEKTMNLNDAIARFRSLDEANIPAPAVNRETPGDGAQISSKSKFKYYGGADQNYAGDKVGIPADAPAKAAMSHSSNVKGPVGADAREVVDVRIEDIDSDELVGMLEQIAEASDSLEEYAQLIETHLGFDAVVKAFKVLENVESPELLLGRIYESISNPVQGDGPVVDNPMSEANRGVGIDDFVERSSDEVDMAFAQGMMRGETTDAGLSRVAEAAIPAPDPQQVGPDGKQIASKSRFRKYYPGPGQTYDGRSASKTADPETHAAMSHSAGAGGPGYTPDKREETDVRVESMRREGMQFQPKSDGTRPPEPSTTNELDAFAASMSYPTDLINK
jgi:hypothetical protein